MILTVFGVKFYLVFPKDQYSDLCYLIFLYAICFISWQILKFRAKTNHKSVVQELDVSSSILFTWLRNNYMKTNTDKSQLLLSGNNKVTANIDGNIIESEESQVLLGVTIDLDLSFDKHINNLCKNAGAKLNALARIAGYMDIKKT